MNKILKITLAISGGCMIAIAMFLASSVEEDLGLGVLSLTLICAGCVAISESNDIKED